MNIPYAERKFEFKIFDNIYPAVGELIREANNLEYDFDKLLRRHKIKLGKNPLLSKMVEQAEKNKIISKKTIKQIKKVIKVRNYIVHDMFKEIFRGKQKTNFSLEKYENKLNIAWLLITDCIDYIRNETEKTFPDGKYYAMRPTIFDK